MPPEYEPIAEEIIRLFWYSPEHRFNWYVVYKEKLKLPSVSLEEFNRIKPLIKQDLIEEGFIEKVKLSTLDDYRLTKKGRDFISFEHERQKLSKNKRKESMVNFPKNHPFLWEIIKWAIPVICLSALSYFIGLKNGKSGSLSPRKIPDTLFSDTASKRQTPLLFHFPSL